MEEGILEREMVDLWAWEVAELPWIQRRGRGKKGAM